MFLQQHGTRFGKRAVFCFLTKDIHSKKVTLIHRYKRYADASIYFDYLAHGSLDTYEMSFRKLKYTIDLSNFHAYKPEYVKQEIRAKLIAYNATEALINHTVIERNTTTKHVYIFDFSTN